jgi:diguanylate cyclase (GGDEF)-like protein
VRSATASGWRPVAVKAMAADAEDAAVERHGRTADGRHFSGLNTRLVVQFLEARHGEAVLLAVLRRAGETRPVAELLDEGCWSSYDEFRRLLEATATEVGFDQLPHVAPGAEVIGGGAAASAAPVQELGSPEAVLQEGVLSQTTMGMSSIIGIAGGGSSGPGEFRLCTALIDGFAPFRELCAYMQGLTAVVPVVFGLPPGEVVEEACQCDGAEACEFVIRWQVAGGLEEELRSLRARLQVLQGRIDSLEATVADVVTSDDAGATLARIAATAAGTLRAPTHAVVLHDGELAPPVLVVGRSGAEAQVAEAVRRADLGERHGLLVAEITSGQRTFGRLALIEPGRAFRPHEHRVLVSYARLAAAALDSAAAVGSARREAGTASALLRLSASLGQVMTSDDMAGVIASAVPAVIDCDRALVVLADPAAGTARVAATHGYDAATDTYLRGVPLPPPPAGVDILDISYLDPTGPDEVGAEIMPTTGSVAAAVVHIIVDGVTAGQVVASVAERPERLARTPDLEERLRGIAALASAAVRNGLLVDAIRHQATHDALTGLPNRTLILDRLGQLLKARRRGRHPVAVLFLDLDGFKDVNDMLGHEAGDQLLRAVAERLRAAVRQGDTVGRLGGDEFVVVVDGEEAGPTPEAVAERILAVLREPVLLDGRQSLAVTASIGIAVGTAEDPGEVLREADVALYEAKAAGKSRAVRFRPAMGRQVHERLAIGADLQRALAEQQFFLLYQPIVDLVAERVTGVEALLRWRHPIRGVVPPVDFVPLLEDNGLILPVGAWVLSEACRQASSWELEGHPLGMSVNVSPRQLERPELVAHVRAALDDSGLEPGRLTVEITEGAIMRDPEAAARRLDELRGLGVRVAIDDFGVGYSSLAAIRDFHVDVLKIDRSFVAALRQSHQSRSLVRLFLQLGRELGMACVAEGVEEAGQLDQLRVEQCEAAQGYFFSQPVAPDEISRLLAQGVLAPVAQPTR